MYIASAIKPIETGYRKASKKGMNVIRKTTQQKDDKDGERKAKQSNETER